MKTSSIISAFVFAATAALVVACSTHDSGSANASISTAPEINSSANATSTHQHPRVELTREQKLGVIRVLNATARYRDFRRSQKAGYTSQYPAGCAASADGAQGLHYMNPALVDAKVELLKPELVMYEPQRNGTLELVGVDYVVPFDAWKSPSAPTLLGVPFMRNEPLGVWALHIWAWRPNPSGMFAMWNPTVSCKYAK